jgi:hypothetical protein
LGTVIIPPEDKSAIANSIAILLLAAVPEVETP